MTTRTCACGCGSALPPTAPSFKKYLDATHKNAARYPISGSDGRTQRTDLVALQTVRKDNSRLRHELVLVQTELERQQLLLDRFSFVAPGHAITPKWVTTTKFGKGQ